MMQFHINEMMFHFFLAKTLFEINSLFIARLIKSDAQNTFYRLRRMKPLQPPDITSEEEAVPLLKHKRRRHKAIRQPSGKSVSVTNSHCTISVMSIPL